MYDKSKDRLSDDLQLVPNYQKPEADKSDYGGLF
jgi:hypothetical protein